MLAEVPGGTVTSNVVLAVSPVLISVALTVYDQTPGVNVLLLLLAPQAVIPAIPASVPAANSISANQRAARRLKPRPISSAPASASPAAVPLRVRSSATGPGTANGYKGSFPLTVPFAGTVTAGGDTDPPQ